MKQAHRGLHSARVAPAALGIALAGALVAATAQALDIEAEPGVALVLNRTLAEPRARPAAAGTPVRIVPASAAAALARLCAGRILAVGIDRAWRPAERAACAAGKVEPIDIPLATSESVLIVHPRNDWATGISAAQLRAALAGAPRAQTWKALDPSWPDAPLKLYVPGEAGSGHVALRRLAGLADEVAPGGPGAQRVRADAASPDLPWLVAEAVARDREALGIIDQATWRTHGARVKRLALPGAQAHAATVRLLVAPLALGDAQFVALLRHLLADTERLAADAGLSALAPAEYAEARRQAAAVLALLPDAPGGPAPGEPVQRVR